MGKCMECSSREQHCCDPGIPMHCEAPTNEYILFLSFAHGHGRPEWQFRATRLVKKEVACVNYQYMQLRSGSGLYFLVCSVLILLYREGAKCNLGLFQQWGCWGFSGMWLLLPGRRTPNNNCSIQPFIWALSWRKEMPSEHQPTVKAPDHQETLNNL